jgi:hypothetical protein
MQCKNCGKAADQHNAVTRACPSGKDPLTPGQPGFHGTQVFEGHRQCKHKCDGICGKAGPA